MIPFLGLFSIPVVLAFSQVSTISISPPFQEVSVSGSDPQKSFVVSVTNNGNSVEELHLSVKDFGSAGEFGGILLLNKEDVYSKKYGLASWVNLEKDSLVVPPQNTQRVKISITNKDSLFPGGHYAALLVSSINPKTGQEISLQPTITSLILARKLGGQVYNLSVESADSDANPLTPPEQIKLTFKNAGNVHLIPRGLITVFDPIGREIDRAAVNEDSIFVLPETIRLQTNQLTKEDFSFVPGVYKVNVAYRYVGTDSVAYFQTNYFYFGWPASLVTVIVLGIIISLVRTRAKITEKLCSVKRKLALLNYYFRNK